MYSIREPVKRKLNSGYLFAGRRVQALAVSILIRSVNRIAASLFIRNVVFVFLPFKVTFPIAVIYRDRLQNRNLDGHFVFCCGPKIRSHIDWILNSWLWKRFPNSIIICLILAGYHKEALALFPQIDWSRSDDQFAADLERLILPILSGYSTDLLVQIHTIGWKDLPVRTRPHFVRLLMLMLEHRNYEYEDRIFAGKKSVDGSLSDLRIEKYVPLFFKDKELIGGLASELKLSGVTETLDALDAEGQHWESLPVAHPQRTLLSDISLFYAYRHLMLKTYHDGDGHLVPALYKGSLKVQNRLRRSLPAPSTALKRQLDLLGVELSDVKLLSPDWSALIGHNGHLHVHLMMRQMGWWKGSPLLLAYKERIANKPFLSLFSEICPTLTLGENVSSEVWHELAGLTPFIGVSHQAFAFEDGTAMYWNDAGGMAVNQWDADDRGFPLRDIYDHRLTIDDEPETRFAELRAKWGMGPRDWHVCLHMRDAATRGETVGAGESIRSTSIDNYLDAVRHITDKGGWVIRMGGPKVPAMPIMARVIDYARSPDQSSMMDIHLVRKARAFIGTTSGFAYVASNFGVPTAMVNAISSVGLLWSKDTRFALKPIYTLEGRMLNQREVTSEQWRWAYPTYESLARAGLSVSDSSSDEILETVKEVLSLSVGDASVTDAGLIRQWRSNVSILGFYGSALPSRYFLDKYAGSRFLEAGSVADESSRETIKLKFG